MRVPKPSTYHNIGNDIEVTQLIRQLEYNKLSLMKGKGQEKEKEQDKRTTEERERDIITIQEGNTANLKLNKGEESGEEEEDIQELGAFLEGCWRNSIEKVVQRKRKREEVEIEPRRSKRIQEKGRCYYGGLMSRVNTIEKEGTPQHGSEEIDVEGESETTEIETDIEEGIEEGKEREKGKREEEGQPVQIEPIDYSLIKKGTRNINGRLVFDAECQTEQAWRLNIILEGIKREAGTTEASTQTGNSTTRAQNNGEYNGYGCTWCPTVWESHCSLKRHFDAKHRPKEVQCLQCGGKYASNNGLLRHIKRAHTKEGE